MINTEKNYNSGYWEIKETQITIGNQEETTEQLDNYLRGVITTDGNN